MLELTKSAMSLSWGLSLLGAQQALGVFMPGKRQAAGPQDSPTAPAPGPGGPGIPTGPPDYFKEFSIVPGWGPMPTRKPS